VLRDTVDPTASPRRPASYCAAVSLACSFAVVLIASGWAEAEALPTLNTVAYNALRSVAGSYRYTLDCTYGPQYPGTLGVAFPPYHGKRAQVFVRPWICAAANRAASGRWDASNGVMGVGGARAVVGVRSADVRPGVLMPTSLPWAVRTPPVYS